jgi:hypothetical protein
MEETINQNFLIILDLPATKISEVDKNWHVFGLPIILAHTLQMYWLEIA